MKLDALESTLNATIGLLVSWLATRFLLPLWGLHPSAADATWITAMFFALSFTRAFILRRIFRQASKKGEQQ